MTILALLWRHPSGGRKTASGGEWGKTPRIVLSYIHPVHLLLSEAKYRLLRTGRPLIPWHDKASNEYSCSCHCRQHHSLFRYSTTFHKLDLTWYTIQRHYTTRTDERSPCAHQSFVHSLSSPSSVPTLLQATNTTSFPPTGSVLVEEPYPGVGSWSGCNRAAQ
jgi:hypothetical protein